MAGVELLGVALRAVDYPQGSDVVDNMAVLGVVQVAATVVASVTGDVGERNESRDSPDCEVKLCYLKHVVSSQHAKENRVEYSVTPQSLAKFSSG